MTPPAASGNRPEPRAHELPGPSRRIVVEPLRKPAPTPPPRPGPAPAPERPQPAREPAREEPART